MNRTDDGSILAHIEANLPPDGGPGLTTAGYRLPDDEPMADGQLRWAPAALAGVLGHHTMLRESGSGASQALDLVRACRVVRPGRRARRRLCQWAARNDPQAVAAELLSALRNEYTDAARPGVRARDLNTARWLAFKGRHRDPVKLGIALLALGHDAGDRDRLLTLARHDGLSVFVLATLTTATGDPDGSAFAVAEVTKGWGRVGAVNRLSRTSDPLIQRWLVCGGYRATPFGYTEINAAWADMLGQLQRIEGTDQELVDGAVGVMRALLWCREWGPSDHIGDYVEAADALELLFELTTRHEARFAHHDLAREARNWLLHWDGEDDVVIPEERRSSLIGQAEQVMARLDWPGLAIRALADPHHGEFELAEEVAAAAGHDTFPALLASLDHGGSESLRWHRAAATAGPSRIARVVERAEHRLILPTANEYGSTVHHNALYVMEVLPTEQPGLGWPLVAAALRSRQSDRWPAYRALERWGRVNWPPEAEPALRAMLVTLTDSTERVRVEELLAAVP